MKKFERLSKVIGSPTVEYLHGKKVLVLGCGGVGGYVIEALARSNIGTLFLVDYDIVEETNLNRQIVALSSTIGKKKVDVLEERIKDISLGCNVIKICEFINEENIEQLFSYDFDFFVDACDSIGTKKAVIKECLKRNIPFLSSMGTGNRLDPSQLEIMDIRKTNYDPIARILRKFIKDEKIKEKVLVLSSHEIPMKNHERTPGSTSFVPPSAGLLIASYIVRYFIDEAKNK